MPTLSALDMVTAILLLYRGSATRAVLGNVGYYRKALHIAYITTLTHLTPHFTHLRGLPHLPHHYTNLRSLTHLTHLKSLVIQTSGCH